MPQNDTEVSLFASSSSSKRKRWNCNQETVKFALLFDFTHCKWVLMVRYYTRDLTNSQICLILRVCMVSGAVFLGAIAGFTPRIESHGDRSGTVVKVLCYKSEGRWFNPNQWIFH